MHVKDKLDIIKSIATICASVAIPIILGFYGHKIQKEISSESLKKDYVQMAVGILNEKREGQDAELRKWAVSIINSNSPVPFGKNLREQLEGGKIVIPAFKGTSVDIRELLRAPERRKEK